MFTSDLSKMAVCQIRTTGLLWPGTVYQNIFQASLFFWYSKWTYLMMSQNRGRYEKQSCLASTTLFQRGKTHKNLVWWRYSFDLWICSKYIERGVRVPVPLYVHPIHRFHKLSDNDVNIPWTGAVSCWFTRNIIDNNVLVYWCNRELFELDYP